MARSVGLSWVLLLVAGACSAGLVGCSAMEPDARSAVIDEAAAARARAFDERMAPLRDVDRSEELSADQSAPRFAAIDARAAASPALAAFVAAAGAPGAPIAERVLLRDGSAAVTAARTYRDGDAESSVESRVTLVNFERGEPLLYAERFTPGEDRVELFVLEGDALLPVGNTTLAAVATPRAISLPGEAESGDATSVEAINRTACGACRLAYGALQAAGCRWGAAALCTAAGVPTAGAGLALCGVLVTAVCRFGLSQIRPLDPTLVCNWIGGRVSRDQQWCAEAPRTCTDSYFDAAETDCDRCQRFARCATTSGCRVGSSVLCAVIGGDDSAAEGRVCREGADAICDRVDRDTAGAALSACRERGYCR